MAFKIKLILFFGFNFQFRDTVFAGNGTRRFQEVANPS